ncbi:hypothetical protein [Flagellimonas pelagia]|nr:hypothetical protein [Allomuricauda maritima]TXJ92150.1 hypothetical protein FQ017_15045 [Allomuricauda maritima]
MNYIPAHQFEIRFTNILDFPSCMYDIVAPFVQLTTGLRIENENSHNAIIHLFFKDTFDTISIRWDRIIYKSENHKDNLVGSKSFFQEPFLNLFAKIKGSKHFGQIKNILYYSMFININEQIDLEESRKRFSENYFKDGINNIIPLKTDIGIVIEKTTSSGQVSLNMGPYSGPMEIQKHGKGNFIIEDIDTLKNITGFGEIIILNILRNTNSFSFNDYKDLHLEAKSLTEQSWSNEQ